MEINKKDGNGIVPEGKFRDWSEVDRTPYQYTNEQIIEYFGNPIGDPDTNNATVIRYDLDCKPARSASWRYWLRLSQYNSGSMNYDWVNEHLITYEINSHLIEGLMGQLEMNAEQRSKAYRYFMGLDLADEGRHAELVAFCVCAITVHRDDSKRSYHYNQQEENKDPLFTEVAKKLGLDQGAIRSLYANHEQRITRGTLTLNLSYLRHEKRKQIVPSLE